MHIVHKLHIPLRLQNRFHPPRKPIVNIHRTHREHPDDRPNKAIDRKEFAKSRADLLNEQPMAVLGVLNWLTV